MVTPNQNTYIPGEIDSLTGRPVVGAERVRTAPAQTLDAALLALRADIPDGSVGSFDRLPAVARNGQVALVGDQFYRGHELSEFRITMTPADDPQGASDDRGYVRGSFGMIDHESQFPFFYEWRYDDDGNTLLLRIESTTDTGGTFAGIGDSLGTYNLRKTAGDGAGIYSTWATRGSGRYQYEADVQTDPFQFITRETFTFRPAAPVTYWQQIEIAAATDSNVGGVAFTAPDERKLAGIEVGATGDQTPAEIKVAYESNPNTNAFDDAEQTKLAGIEDNATADQTASEIKQLYESNADTNPFTDAQVRKLAGIEEGATVGGGDSGGLERVNRDGTLSGDGTADSPLGVVNPFTATDEANLDAAVAKLAGIESGATGDQTDAEIKAAYERNANTNAFTDAAQTKLAGIEDGAKDDQTPAQIRDALAGLTGNNRLSAAAIRDLGDRAEFYATVAARDAATAPPAGTLGVIHADTPARNGFYFRTNTGWDALLVGPHYTDAAADLRVQAAKGTAAASNIAVGAGSAGTSNRWAPIDHAHGYEDPGSGDGGNGYTDAQADARVEAYTGQSGPRGTIAINRMIEQLQQLARDVVEGGPRLWPTTDIRIGGPIRAQEYTGNAQARVAVFGTSATHDGDTAIGPNTHFFMQFDKTDFPTQPTTADIPSNLRIRTGGSGPSYQLQQPVLTRLLISSATHWVFNARIGITPADDPTIYLDIIEGTRTRTLPVDGSLTPDMMAGLADAQVGDVITRGPEDTFGHHVASARREVYNGTQGIAVTRADQRSGLAPTAFDTTLNRDTAGDTGLLFATSRRRLVTRSSTSISYAPDSVVTETYATGFADLATLAAHPVYDGSGNLGVSIVAHPVYLAPAGTLLGHEIVYVPADATSMDYESLAAFEPITGSTQSTLSWGSSGTTKLDFDDFGASVPGGGAGGQIRFYASALPAAAGIPDNTFGVVLNPASTSVKQTVITQGSQDTGWAGKTIDPHLLATAHVGPYTLRYAASAAFTFTRNAHTATVPAGGATAVSGGLPAGGRLVWSRETAGNGSGLLEADYTSDRTATGPIVVTVGTAVSHVYRLAMANARAWDSGLLGADSYPVLAGQADWQLTEPDGSGHVAVEQWTPINLGGGGSGDKGDLTRQSLAAAISLADPTQNEVSNTAWVDVFSHTVTAAEGAKGFMLITADVFATLALTTAGDATSSPDRGGDRPLLVVRLIKGTEEQGRNYRYFRFSGGVPLDCVLAEIISVAANDVIKVQAQMSRLTAAGTTLGASLTTETHWAILSTSG